MSLVCTVKTWSQAHPGSGQSESGKRGNEAVGLTFLTHYWCILLRSHAFVKNLVTWPHLSPREAGEVGSSWTATWDSISITREGRDSGWAVAVHATGAPLSLSLGAL